MSRDTTEALPLTYLARAPLELVPLQPIKPPVVPTPRREKKSLIIETLKSVTIDKNRSNEASSSKVKEVDKTNAVIVESKDDRIARGAESRDDNAFGTKTDAVAKKQKATKFLRNAIQRQMENKQKQRPRQQQQLSTAAEPESAQPQRTAEQFVEVPDEAGTSSQQRTVEQVIEVPDLDSEQFDESQQVKREEGQVQA